MIRSARKGSLVSTVVERLRQFVEEKKLQSGDRLPTEAELLKQFGVSRTVLREAVGRLETIGLVAVRHGQGMFVGDPDTLAGCLSLLRSAMAISPRDLTQFAEFRTALECHTARRSAELASPEDVAQLEAALRPDGPAGLLPYEEAIPGRLHVSPEAGRDHRQHLAGQHRHGDAAVHRGRDAPDDPQAA